MKVFSPGPAVAESARELSLACMHVMSCLNFQRVFALSTFWPSRLAMGHMWCAVLWCQVYQEYPSLLAEQTAYATAAATLNLKHYRVNNLAIENEKVRSVSEEVDRHIGSFSCMSTRKDM